MRVLTAAEARAFDRWAIDELAVPALVLMENAALALAEAIATDFGEARRVAIFCGPGNNGGDGLAAARHLGRRARVHLLAEPDPQRAPDAALQLRILRAAGHPLTAAPPDPDSAQDLVWVDALFGTGLARGLAGAAAAWVECFNRAAGRKLCVDIPSGLDGDSGLPLGPACRGEVTVTFVAPKRGLVTPAAAPYVGKLVVVGLGLPEEAPC